MGLRFQKRIRIMKGVWINLSKGGASLSVGDRGTTVNLGKRGVKGTVGAPGTGISYSEQIATPKSASWGRIVKWIVLLAVVYGILHFVLR